MQTMDEALFTLVREGRVLARDAAPHLSNADMAAQLEKLEPPSARREAA
jgi:Tfp pilus assembly ATPase PilU